MRTAASWVFAGLLCPVMGVILGAGDGVVAVVSAGGADIGSRAGQTTTAVIARHRRAHLVFGRHVRELMLHRGQLVIEDARRLLQVSMTIRTLAAIGVLSVSVVDLHDTVAVTMIPGSVSRERRSTVRLATRDRRKQGGRNVMFVTDGLVLVAEVVLVQDPMRIACRNRLGSRYAAMAKSFRSCSSRAGSGHMHVIQDSRWIADVAMIGPVRDG